MLGIYGDEDVNILLQYATMRYLDKEVEMSFPKNYVVLPKVFSTFANDFGKGIWHYAKCLRLLALSQRHRGDNTVDLWIS